MRNFYFILIGSLFNLQITQLEEKNSEATDSNHQQELVPCSNKTSSQTFCKTLLSPGASSATSLSYCSIRDDSQSNLPQLQNSVERELGNNARNNNLKFNFHQAQDPSNTVPKCLQYSHDRNPDTYLSSESSSYKSFSSIANVTSPLTLSKNQLESRFGETHESEICDNFLSSQEVQETTELTISYPGIYVSSRIRAILSHIVSPDDFWMQLEDTKELPSFQT